MKKSISVFVVLVLLVLLCSCSSTATTETKNPEPTSASTVEATPAEEKKEDPIDENEANGYFRILHTSSKDQWGEIKEGPEYLVAIAEASNKDGVYKGIVYLYFNYKQYPYRDYDPHNFYFFVPVPNKQNTREIIKRVDYMIGEEKDYFMCDYEDDGFVSEDNQPGLYEFLRNAFESGEDIVFNVKSGGYIFTIHGEGFADLIAK